MSSGQLLCGLLALVLTGCATARRDGARATDWEDLDGAQPVTINPIAPIKTPAPAASPGTLPEPPPSPAPSPTRDAFESQFAGDWVPLNRWSKTQDLGAPVRVGSTPTPTYVLATTNGSFVLRIGNQSAQWEGLEVRLGFPPQLIDGQPYLHTLDVRKTLLPLLQRTRPGLRDPPVIVIDPGHGGENSGTKSVLGNWYEKDYTLDWALRLRSLLLTNGWRVFLTRTNDTDLALSNRVALAERFQADLFLSLHFNSAAPNQVESGLETYSLTPVGMPSTLTRGFGDDPTQAFPNNAFDSENLRLAYRVHRALLQVNGNQDRGLRRARFLGVLRGQQRPAILVEGGYLSNPHEARQIADPNHRQKLAEAVAKALEAYLRSRETAPVETANKNPS